MFSTQDSIDYGPDVISSVGYPQEAVSPVRKKGRSKHSLRDNTSSKDTEGINPFALSQDSMVASQFSQNFAERMGQMNMFCSQDNSMMSSSESTFSVPFLPTGVLGTASDNTYQNSRISSFSAGAGIVKTGSSSTNPPMAMETEKAIDIPPPVKNVFLQGTRPPGELYFDPSGNFGQGPPNKKAKRPTKVWIGAFKDRPRIITEFEELKLLGEGTFSTVMCVRHRLDGTLYAVKRVRESIVSERRANTLLREVNALAALQGCEQIVRYYSSWIDSHHLFIQTELCHLGSLEDLYCPKPSHSSIIHTASVALRALQTGTHLSGNSRTSANPLQEVRNRSESFNSIDLNDCDALLQDEYLTAPGQSTQQNTTTGMYKPPAGTKGGLFRTTSVSSNHHSVDSAAMGNDSNSATFMTQDSSSRTCSLPRADTSTGNQSGPRGVSEDLAWLVLYDLSLALKFMHEREMAHLDLRPANVFLTASSQYVDMDSQDPQTLLLTVAQGGSDVPVKSASIPLFASILSANSLGQGSYHSEQCEHRMEDSGSSSSGDASMYATYNVRAEVERLLVQRKYVIRLGDFGHCCRIDEKSAIQEGQTRYCPRELINLEEECLDATQADMFSLGASVYELCLGRFLGSEGDEGIAEWHRIRDGHLDVSLSQHYSPALVEVLQSLLHPDPAQRPTAASLATHMLQSKYPYPADRRSAIFPPSSNSREDKLAQLQAENAQLRAKLGLLV